MWKIIFGLVLTIGLFVTVPVQAAIIYVNKDNACPGSGTSAAPYCSIANAVNAVNAGDTIRIRDAATPYNETIETSKNGTSGSPITVEPDIGHNPRLLNSGNGSQCATFYIYGNYWTIRNLNFDATGQNSCVFGAILIISLGHDVTGHQILNNTFKGWGDNNNSSPGASAVIVSGGSNAENVGYYPNNILIQGNTFDSNRMSNLQIIHSRNITVKQNEFKGTKCGVDWDATDTIGILEQFTSSNVTIDGNTFHDFQPYSGCTTPIVGYPTYVAYWCDVGGHNGVIKNNIIYNLDVGGNPADELRFVTGIFIESRCDGYTVANNLIYNVKSTGFMQDFHSFNVSQPPNLYYNNTIYNTKYGFFLKQGVLQMKNNIVKNAGTAAICFGNGCGNGGTTSLSLTADYNLYDDGGNQTKIVLYSGSLLNFTNWKTQCKCDSHSLNTNPFLVNPPSDFHLQSSSPARGAGEAGADVGAYPYIGNQTLFAPTNLQIVPN